MEVRIKVTEIQTLNKLGLQSCLLSHHEGQGSQWILLDPVDPEEENHLLLNKHHFTSQFAAADKTKELAEKSPN